MIESFRAVGNWARGRGSTRFVDRPGRGGKHYDPGGRRDVSFVSPGPQYRRPGSVITSVPRGNPITPSPSAPPMRGEWKPTGTGRTSNPHRRNLPSAKPPAVASRMAPANPAKRHQPQRVIDGGYNASEHLSASAESSFRAGVRSRPGSHFPVAAPQRFPGSAGRAAARTRANEFVSGQKGHDRRTLDEGRGKYSSGNDPVGARMREAQSGLTSDILGNIGEILMTGAAFGSLTGPAGVIRAGASHLARKNAPRMVLSLPKKPMGIRAGPSLRPPRPELPTPPPPRGIQYVPPKVPTSPLRIGSPPVRPSGIPFRSSSSPSNIRIRKDAAPAAPPKTAPKVRKPRAVKGRQRQ